MKFFRRRRNDRHNIFYIAFKHFPGSLLKTGIGITLLAAPFLLTIFSDLGVDSLAVRIALNGLIIVIVPTSLLFVITLFRAPNIRRRSEEEAEKQLRALSIGLQKEEKEIVRLQEVVTSDINERRVKEKKEEERWDLLNERLRIQEETERVNVDLKEERETARQESESEERLAVAQQVKDLKDERELSQRESASVDLIARQVKDLREDERWELLNERLRVQEAAGREDSDLTEKKETYRQKIASDNTKAQALRSDIDDDRWIALHERMRVQEEKGVERENAQIKRDEEHHRMRTEDQLQAKYRTLLERFIRHAAARGLAPVVADGLAPIPEAWLRSQPEILKDPALLTSISALNKL